MPIPAHVGKYRDWRLIVPIGVVLMCLCASTIYSVNTPISSCEIRTAGLSAVPALSSSPYLWILHLWQSVISPAMNAGRLLSLLFAAPLLATLYRLTAALFGLRRAFWTMLLASVGYF